MLRFFSIAKKYLTPIWLYAEPTISPIMNYFKKGTINSALLLAFTIGLLTWFILWGLTPMLLSNFHPPVSVTGGDLVNLKPQQWERYTIETNGAVPIGIRSWYEQREFGVITTYRSDNLYWGVYIVDDYFIYFQSDRDDNLVRPPQTLTGRLGYVGKDTLNQLDELMPDMPDTVLTLLYSPQTLQQDISSGFSLLMLSFLLLGIAWFFHHQAIKQNGGRVNPAFYGQWIQKVKSSIKFLSEIVRWLWIRIKQLFRASFWSATRASGQTYKERHKAQSSGDENKHRVITIDPSKIRSVDED